jgi:hypothetical protein
MEYKDIYDLVKSEESNFFKPITLEDGWDWSMKEHLRRSFLYKHSQFEENNDNRRERPFKNIIRPILNAAYRTEGFDVKDIELYVDNPDIYFKSFLVDKYHDDWALDNSIDTFIDEVVVSYVDYGGTLVKNSGGIRPEVVDLRTICFCNQKDILSSPFAFKYKYTPSELRKMAKEGKWGDGDKKATISVDDLITMNKGEKEIEVYEVYGELPANWIGIDSKDDVLQFQIVSFYKDGNKKDIGNSLFKSKLPKLPFKMLKRDDIKGRALGFGGVEELFEPQIWTNFSEIKITEMLQAAAKIIHKTTDATFKTRNNLRNIDNNEVLVLGEGKDITQLDVSPRNLPVFNDAVKRWEEHAQTMGSASEALLGETPNSGTPFKLYEAQSIEGKGMHKYRQGQIAVFIDEIYREWIIPHIEKEITKEHTFLSELSFDELQKISEQIVDNEINKLNKKRILNGELIDKNLVEEDKNKIRQNFLKGGNKRFIKILSKELEDVSLKVKTNIANKQKNLALLTDKIVNVLRQFISTPEIRQDPEMVKLLNTILESSGMSPIMFSSSIIKTPVQQIQGKGGTTEPLTSLAETTSQNIPQTSLSA